MGRRLPAKSLPSLLPLFIKKKKKLLNRVLADEPLINRAGWNGDRIGLDIFFTKLRGDWLEMGLYTFIW